MTHVLTDRVGSQLFQNDLEALGISTDPFDSAQTGDAEDQSPPFMVEDASETYYTWRRLKAEAESRRLGVPVHLLFEPKGNTRTHETTVLGLPFVVGASRGRPFARGRTSTPTAMMAPAGPSGGASSPRPISEAQISKLLRALDYIDAKDPEVSNQGLGLLAQEAGISQDEIKAYVAMLDANTRLERKLLSKSHVTQKDRCDFERSSASLEELRREIFIRITNRLLEVAAYLEHASPVAQRKQIGDLHRARATIIHRFLNSPFEASAAFYIAIQSYAGEDLPEPSADRPYNLTLVKGELSALIGLKRSCTDEMALALFTARPEAEQDSATYRLLAVVRRISRLALWAHAKQMEISPSPTKGSPEFEDVKYTTATVVRASRMFATDLLAAASPEFPEGYKQALEEIRRARAFYEQLGRLDPSAQLSQDILFEFDKCETEALRALGDICRKAGKTDEAQRLAEEEVVLLQKIARLCTDKARRLKDAGEPGSLAFSESERDGYIVDLAAALRNVGRLIESADQFLLAAENTSESVIKNTPHVALLALESLVDSIAMAKPAAFLQTGGRAEIGPIASQALHLARSSLEHTVRELAAQTRASDDFERLAAGARNLSEAFAPLSDRIETSGLSDDMFTEASRIRDGLIDLLTRREAAAKEVVAHVFKDSESTIIWNSLTDPRAGWLYEIPFLVDKDQSPEENKDLVSDYFFAAQSPWRRLSALDFLQTRAPHDTAPARAKLALHGRPRRKPGDGPN